jgi:hypothetical protein
MKKIFAFIASVGLAFGTVPAFAAGDPGCTTDGPVDWEQEFVSTMCALTGLEYYCEQVDPTYKSPPVNCP